MSFISTLSKRIAPELNHIYTSQPFQFDDGGYDAGWFCREHAFHVYILAKLFNLSSDIRRGDFLVSAPNCVPIHSVGAPFDHMWCRVADSLPVDLSMTFRHFGAGPQLAEPICKKGSNGCYLVHYERKHSDVFKYSVGSVVFFEDNIIRIPPEQLLRDPYQLLHPPNKDDSSNWDSVYGPEIYSQITLHCFRLATRQANPIRERLSPSDSPDWIAKEYPNAHTELLEILSKL